MCVRVSESLSFECVRERVGVCSCVHLSVYVRRFDGSKALDDGG